MAPTRKGKRGAKAPRPTRAHAGAEGLFAADERIEDRHFEAFQQVVAAFQGRPDVTGVDIGFQVKDGVETGEIAIRVHVRRKLSKKALSARDLVPRRLRGVRLDVIEATYVKQYGAGTEARRERVDVVRPGVSVSHARSTAGTLGLFVQAADATALLGAAHVLAPDVEARAGDPILQPGRADAGRPEDAIATLLRFDLATDTAIALVGPARPIDRAQEGSGVLVQPGRYPVLGELLEKSGRSSGVTRARIDGIGSYDGVAYSFRLVPPLPSPAAPLITEDGDSGAVWYGVQDLRGVGVHCRRGPNPNPLVQYGVASSILKSAGRLGYSLVAGG